MMKRRKEANKWIGLALCSLGLSGVEKLIRGIQFLVSEVHKIRDILRDFPRIFLRWEYNGRSQDINILKEKDCIAVSRKSQKRRQMNDNSSN